MFFSVRETKKEIMDDHSIVDQRMFNALDELKIINKYLGGIQTTKSGIKILTAGSKKKVFQVLDIGSGFSDVFKYNSHSRLDIIHVDINAGIMKSMRAANPGETCVCADASQLCFKQKCCDIIHLSLFLHHLEDVQIKLVLSELLKSARIGIIINDLRRNIAAYLGIKMLTAVFSRSQMVKNDGPLSVRKAFVKADFDNLLLNVRGNYIIKRKWAFRWLVCIFNDEYS